MKGPTNSSVRPNIRLLNVSATFESNPDTSNNTEFPYRASIQADGISEYMSATVMFSQIQATSGIFATYCQTGDGVIYIYAKTNPTPNEGDTITIPAVSCDLSVNYINVDNVPTEDSQAVITSGGVYDALEDKLTKDASLTDGALLKWDATSMKAVDEGTVGDDTKPIKIVNGVAVEVTNDLQLKIESVIASNGANLSPSTPKYDIVSVTAPISGKATITINGGFQNYNEGYRLIGYAKNTTSVQTEWILNTNANGDFMYYSAPIIIDVNAGDVIYGCAYQTSSATLNCYMTINMVIYPM